ncbi:MAG: hypothetical protein IID41_00395 [Planctomycetes bacterium]|nr:hypothetical protein [Planctomycetota bacterium]
MATPHQAFAAAVKGWQDEQIGPLRRELIRNFSGRMFQRRTGKMLSEVLAGTTKIKWGIRTSTSNPALIAWMLGSNRKAFFVKPKKAGGVLSWTNKAGSRFFSRGHLIPAWTFRPVRPALEDAMARRIGPMVQAMRRRSLVAMTVTLPNERIVLQINL